MKTPHRLGLIVEGNTTKSKILRFPGIAEYIGPIKAAVLGVAHRVADLIGAGDPVKEYEELRECDMVLIHVPDASVARVVTEIAGSELPLTGVLYVLCESWLPSSVLAGLAKKGALTATLLTVPAESGNWFAIEGQYAAVKRTQRLLYSLDASSVELKAGSKHLYFAASAFVETLPRVLLAAAQRSLREAGISGNHLNIVLGQMAVHMFQDLTKGSRAGWIGPILECPEEIAAGYLVRLQDTLPEVAALLTQQIKLAEPFLMKRIQRRGKRERPEAPSGGTQDKRPGNLPN